MTDFGPTLVRDTYDAARAVLPSLIDVRGGYTLEIERLSPDAVHLTVGLLARGKESTVAQFKVRTGDDVAAAIHKRLPDLPRCACGCDGVVRQGSRIINGHTSPSLVLGGTCRNGHALTDRAALQYRADGSKACRACSQASGRRSNARRRKATKNLTNLPSRGRTANKASERASVSIPGTSSNPARQHPWGDGGNQ